MVTPISCHALQQLFVSSPYCWNILENSFAQNMKACLQKMIFKKEDQESVVENDPFVRSVRTVKMPQLGDTNHLVYGKKL